MKKLLGNLLPFGLLGYPALAEQTLPAPIRPSWTISSDDCVRIESEMFSSPWLECGIQDVAINADGSRILTISKSERVQLWDGSGKLIAEIPWPKGFKSNDVDSPNGIVAVSGNLGIANAYRNRFAIIDLNTGEVKAQQITKGIVSVYRMKTLSDGRVFAMFSNGKRNDGAGEISLIDGTFGNVRFGRTYPTMPPLHYEEIPLDFRVEGSRNNYTIHFADPARAPLQSPRRCIPVDQANCFYWEPGDREIHVLDLETAKWRSVPMRHDTNSQSFIEVYRAGKALLASICQMDREIETWVRPYSDRTCWLIDLADGREFHELRTGPSSFSGAVDETGTPELRIRTWADGQQLFRASAKGIVREMSASKDANLDIPGDGMLVPLSDNEEQSRYVGKDGVEIARFDFPLFQCHDFEGRAPGGCRLTADGSKFLVPLRLPPPQAVMESEQELQILNIDYALFEVPAGRQSN